MSEIPAPAPAPAPAPFTSLSTTVPTALRNLSSMQFYFDHEKLEAYQLAINFVGWVENLLEECAGKSASAKKHLDEASSSIANNIAEGNGKWSKKDRKRFF